MMLFTKTDCERCEWVKQNCDLTTVRVMNVDDDAEALARLAYYECVRIAEKQGVPILVVGDDADNRSVTVGARMIAMHLGRITGGVPLVDDCEDACVVNL